MHGSNVTDDGMEHIAKIPKLRGLNLTETKVTGAGLAQLRSAHDFVTLTLYGATVDDEMLKTLDQLPNLQYLQLIRTKVTSAGLVHLAELTKLRKLDILENPGVGDDGMRHISNLKNIEVLELWRTPVSDDGLRHLRSLGRLKSLDPDQTLVSYLGMAHLRGLINQMHFSWAILSWRLGIKAVFQIDSIQRLEIGTGRVTDAGLIRVSNMQSLRVSQYLPVLRLRTPRSSAQIAIQSQVSHSRPTRN